MDAAGKTIVFLRIAMGWLFFYSGITKILDPSWSAAQYLNDAKTFPSFFQSLAGEQTIGAVNFLNEWGLTLIGAALILGVFVRVSSLLGAALMIFYYLPVLEFPLIGGNSYIIDEHIIYALVLWLLMVSRDSVEFNLIYKLFDRR